MENIPSMVVKRETFDGVINSAVALVKQIKAKESVTQEEHDFAEAFIVYAKELSGIVAKMEYQKD